MGTGGRRWTTGPTLCVCGLLRRGTPKPPLRYGTKPQNFGFRWLFARRVTSISICRDKVFPLDFKRCSLPTAQQDLYSFGSTIYNIMTGKPPFQELPSKKVKELYNAYHFPDITGLPCGEINERCWRCEIASAQEISRSFRL